MLLIFLLVVASFVVTMSHARSIRNAQSMASAPYEERYRLWQRHERWNGTAWALLFLFIVISEFFFLQRIAPYPNTGMFLVMIGFILVIWSRLILGRSGAMGIRWFLPERAPVWEIRGPYRILANPMYDGFVFIFLGLGLIFGTIENFYLAAASFLLLNIYLNAVESHGYPFRVF